MGANSVIVIKPTYQKSKRMPVSMVVLAVDERLKTGDSVQALDSPSTLTSRLNGNYTYIAATRSPRKTAPMVLLRMAIRLAVKFSREDDKQADRPAMKRQMPIQIRQLVINLDIPASDGYHKAWLKRRSVYSFARLYIHQVCATIYTHIMSKFECVRSKSRSFTASHGLVKRGFS